MERKELVNELAEVNSKPKSKTGSDKTKLSTTSMVNKLL